MANTVLPVPAPPKTRIGAAPISDRQLFLHGMQKHPPLGERCVQDLRQSFVAFHHDKPRLRLCLFERRREVAGIDAPIDARLSRAQYLIDAIARANQKQSFVRLNGKDSLNSVQITLAPQRPNPRNYFLRNADTQ